MGILGFPYIIKARQSQTVWAQPSPPNHYRIDRAHPFADRLAWCHLASHYYDDGAGGMRLPNLGLEVANDDVPLGTSTNGLPVNVLGVKAMQNLSGPATGFGTFPNISSLNPSGVDHTIMVFWNNNSSASQGALFNKGGGGGGNDWSYEVQGNGNMRAEWGGAQVSIGHSHVRGTNNEWILWYLRVDELAALFHSTIISLNGTTQSGGRAAGQVDTGSGARGTTFNGRTGSNNFGALGGFFVWHRFVTLDECREHAYHLWDMFRAPATMLVGAATAAPPAPTFPASLYPKSKMPYFRK